jgi:hypothetical protein
MNSVIPVIPAVMVAKAIKRSHAQETLFRFVPVFWSKPRQGR